MRLYKLTDEHGCTRNNTQWGPGVTHTAKGSGGGLCSDSWIHAYCHPLVAMIMNPIHADIKNPLLWIAEGEPLKFDAQKKLGCKSLTTIRQITPPRLGLEFLVHASIEISLDSATVSEQYREWARRWISKEDRSAKSASIVGTYSAFAAYAFDDYIHGGDNYRLIAYRVAAAFDVRSDIMIVKTLVNLAKKYNITWEE